MSSDGTTTVLDGVAKEVVDLARLKADRQYGALTFDEVITRATGSDGTAPNPFFARMLAKDLNEAEIELKLAITALAGAMPAATASEQIANLMGFAAEGLDIVGKA